MEKNRKETLKVICPEEETIEVFCNKCKNETFHLVLVSAEISGSEELDEYDVFHWASKYQIIRCRGCCTFSFRKKNENSEDIIQTGPQDFEPRVHEEFFPKRESGRIELEEYFRLPGTVQTIYLETISAFNNEQKVLTGIGIRTLIEAVCKEKEARGKDLQKNIEDLVTKDLLSKQNSKILHKLRILGNMAAHEIKPHTLDQLSLGIDIVEHLLKGVYILPFHVKNNFK